MFSSRNIFGPKNLFGRDWFGKGSKLPFPKSKIFPRDLSHREECCTDGDLPIFGPCIDECDFIGLKDQECNCEGDGDPLCDNPDVYVASGNCFFYARSNRVPLPRYTQAFNINDSTNNNPIVVEHQGFILIGQSANCIVPFRQESGTTGRTTVAGDSTFLNVFGLTAGRYKIIIKTDGYMPVFVTMDITGPNQIPDILLVPIPAGKAYLTVSVFELLLHLADGSGSFVFSDQAACVRFTNQTQGTVSTQCNNGIIISPLYDIGDVVNVELIYSENPIVTIQLTGDSMPVTLTHEAKDLGIGLFLGHTLCSPGQNSEDYEEPDDDDDDGPSVTSLGIEWNRECQEDGTIKINITVTWTNLPTSQQIVVHAIGGNGTLTFNVNNGSENGSAGTSVFLDENESTEIWADTPGMSTPVQEVVAGICRWVRVELLSTECYDDNIQICYRITLHNMPASGGWTLSFNIINTVNSGFASGAIESVLEFCSLINAEDFAFGPGHTLDLSTAAFEITPGTLIGAFLDSVPVSLPICPIPTGVLSFGEQSCDGDQPVIPIHIEFTNVPAGTTWKVMVGPSIIHGGISAGLHTQVIDDVFEPDDLVSRDYILSLIATVNNPEMVLAFTQLTPDPC